MLWHLIRTVLARLLLKEEYRKLSLDYPFYPFLSGPLQLIIYKCIWNSVQDIEYYDKDIDEIKK